MHGSIFILLHRQQQMNPTLKLQPVNSIPSLTNSNFHLAHIYFFQTKNMYICQMILIQTLVKSIFEWTMSYWGCTLSFIIPFSQFVLKAPLLWILFDIVLVKFLPGIYSRFYFPSRAFFFASSPFPIRAYFFHSEENFKE